MIPAILPLAVLLSGCKPPEIVASARVRPPQVAYRAGDALPTLGPKARVDLGLRAAAEELAAGALDADARLNPTAIRAALGRAGYPGQARFARVTSGKELPTSLLDALPRDQPLDVGWAWRDFPDGTRWWVVGWSLRFLDLDPMPRDVAVNRAFPFRVDGPEGLRLLIGKPSGAVEEMGFEAGETRWLTADAGPGEYRYEVIGGEKIGLLFSVYAGGGPPAAEPLAGANAVQDPRVATAEIYARVASLRAAVGLPALKVFPAFEPLAREHAACIAIAGPLVHRSESCEGVASLANRLFSPRARFREDLAIGLDADEAWELIMASPGHRANLLCTDCTHLSVGVSLEPAVPPRLYVAWELMDFPEGEPVQLRAGW